MFKDNQRVVCINDDFDPWVYDLYRALPKKGKIYTIRITDCGRSKPTFQVNDDCNIQLKDAEFDILVRIRELVNPPDPYCSTGDELGFRMERFAPLEEIPNKEEVHSDYTPKEGEKISEYADINC